MIVGIAAACVVAYLAIGMGVAALSHALGTCTGRGTFRWQTAIWPLVVMAMLGSAMRWVGLGLWWLLGQGWRTR